LRLIDQKYKRFSADQISGLSVYETHISLSKM